MRNFHVLADAEKALADATIGNIKNHHFALMKQRDPFDVYFIVNADSNAAGVPCEACGRPAEGSAMQLYGWTIVKVAQ